MTSKIKIKGKGISRDIKSRVMLSPLAGVTDKIFRKLVRRWAPNSLLFTEMINATSLTLGYGLEKINQIENDEEATELQGYIKEFISDVDHKYLTEIRGGQ